MILDFLGTGKLYSKRLKFKALLHWQIGVCPIRIRTAMHYACSMIKFHHPGPGPPHANQNNINVALQTVTPPSLALKWKGVLSPQLACAEHNTTILSYG